MKRVICLSVLAVLVLAFTASTYISVKGASSVDVMEALAKSEGVMITYMSADAVVEVSKQYYGNGAYGMYFPSDRHVLVSVSSPCPWWVLAHEMGHHYAITYEGDRSEARADEIAYELILTGNYHK